MHAAPFRGRSKATSGIAPMKVNPVKVGPMNIRYSCRLLEEEGQNAA